MCPRMYTYIHVYLILLSQLLFSSKKKKHTFEKCSYPSVFISCFIPLYLLIYQIYDTKCLQ